MYKQQQILLNKFQCDKPDCDQPDSEIREIITSYRIIVGSGHMHVGFTSRHPTTIIPDSMHPATTSQQPMTPEQIRRRCNDFDDQVRQGLEDGSIRSVMKRIGAQLVSVILTRISMT